MRDWTDRIRADGTFGCVLYLPIMVGALWFASCMKPEHREIVVPARRSIVTPINKALAERVDVKNGWSFTGYRRTAVTMEVEHPLLPKEVKLRPTESKIDPELTEMFKRLKKDTRARTIRTSTLKVGFTRVRDIRTWDEFEEYHGQAGVLGVSYTVWF